MCSPGKNTTKIAPDLRNTENETISDFENQDLAVAGPGDRSGMVFGLTRDVLGYSETILHEFLMHLAPGTLSGISNSTNLKTRSTARH